MEHDRELERLRQVEGEIEQVTDESLEATRNMKRIAAETVDIGAKTLEELDSQGEQLRKVAQDLSGINNEMKIAEKQLTQMERCCGCCLCPCGRSQNFEKTNEYKDGLYGKKEAAEKEQNEEDGLITDQPAASGGNSARYQGARAPKEKGGYINKITNDAREDEMDANIGDVADMLSVMKAQAKSMGDEIDHQDQLMADIESGVDSNAARVEAANVRAMKILKNA